MSNTFDCCILGAGIAGTTSALVLAQLGLRLLVVEAGHDARHVPMLASGKRERSAWRLASYQRGVR